MKDEIKEILDKFDKKLENYELDKKWGDLSVDSIGHLFPNEMKIIKDYITNLEQENENLHIKLEDKANEQIKTMYEEYKSRIDKVIEYIKNCNDKEKLESMFLDESYISNYGAKDLLNILKGGDEE